MGNAQAERRVVIAGGSGFLGRSLAHHLAGSGVAVVILSRHHPRGEGPWRHRPWDARTLDAWCDELDGAVGLVNLTGRSVNCRKAPDHRDEILRSRVESTFVLGDAMRTIRRPPPIWVQMSTAHIYGDPPSLVCTEDSALGCGLAPFIGRCWEDAYGASALPSQRKVVLRAGFVLGRDRGSGGGALPTLCRLARWGLGGRVGHGHQGMSWIHEFDLNRLIERALFDDRMAGVYVASSPSPMAQADFMRELRTAVAMPLGLPVPAWLVRLGARLVFNNDPELILYGRYVVSKRLPDEAFEFRYPSLRSALDDLLGGR